MSERISQPTQSEINPYQVLGVNQSATLEEIKQARNQLVKMYNTDQNGKNGSDERMKKINKAYAILKDPDKRLKLDRELASRAAQTIHVAKVVVDNLLINLGHEWGNRAYTQSNYSDMYEALLLQERVKTSFDIICRIIDPVDTETFKSISKALFQISRKPNLKFLQALERNLNQLDPEQGDGAPELATAILHAFMQNKNYIAHNHRFNPRTIAEISLYCQKDNPFKRSLLKNWKSEDPQLAYQKEINWLKSLSQQGVEY